MEVFVLPLTAEVKAVPFSFDQFYLASRAEGGALRDRAAVELATE